MKVLQIFAVSISALLLAACERTVFQSPPAAAQGCDTALVGRWLSQDDKPEDEGEVEALVAADCTLHLIEHKKDETKRHEPTKLSTARVDGQHYLWFDAAWGNRAFEVDATPLDQAGDVYLFAYRLRRDELSLASPPERPLAHKMLDKDIDGEVQLFDHALTVRVTGESEAIRKVLRRHRLFRFDDEALRFRRAAEDKVK